MADKIVLTDCDGVLLDWESKFATWVQRQGYQYRPENRVYYDIGQQLGISTEEGSNLIARFNCGSDFEHLEPWRDSVDVVRRLHSQGWRFIVITTAGQHPWTWGLRRSNLDRVFGQGVIDELHVLPLHGDKGVKLKDFENSNLYWIEDKPSNAELGYEYGLRPLLMTTEHNKDKISNVQRVNNWLEIERILNDHH